MTTKRSPSPIDNAAKKLKPSSASQPADFNPHLFDPAQTATLAKEYQSAGPYKHSVVESLFSDDLLKQVLTEVNSKDDGGEGGLGGLVGWGMKETDIYKINQSFDLSSLSPEHLPQERLDKLPALCQLKEALYSSKFRNWVREVTGCGPLSQKKVDGSTTRYTKGCHLLLHDDVISTRRISWILYLPSSAWPTSYGGALELYPALPTPDVPFSPENPPKTWREETGSDVFPTKVIPPKWGQFVFFEVQPGKSYHSVEEVVAPEGVVRQSISGWFHKPIEGEEGYEGPEQEGLASSLQQITQSPLSSVLTPYPEDSEVPLPGTPLTPDEITFLKPYFHPQYLQRSTLSLLSQQFGEQSFLLLEKFLHPTLAKELEGLIAARDKADGLDLASRQGGLVPSMAVGEGVEGWHVVGPSTRQRFLSLDEPEGATSFDPTGSPSSSPSPLLSTLLTTVLPSQAFRTWLALITGFVPVARRLEARRFRPGLDYTLARGEDEEVRLDFRLGLTPGEKWEDKEGGEEWGGWEAYLAPPDDDDDPAVYQSSKAQAAQHSHADGEECSHDHSKDGETNGDAAEDEEDDDEDDGPLLTSQPSFNSVMIVMRDAKVMKFTKYLSAAAPGCRWDIGGEWEIGAVEAESDDEDGEGEEASSQDA
ncbi:Predicted component of NuA3 histone acetyltransferase complex [Phaffia rhodozyma]|uniref:Predicted component of NuA3 histone acetyltransferase complex n=1 Tax=Phaffia rhodozyma TaxID=264483 RepID=A0A0F7SXE5_PHARH|nr:Predicted component of NuA3 histone acetyltransferase complex [Phaffia rhodozyma]